MENCVALSDKRKFHVLFYNVVDRRFYVVMNFSYLGKEMYEVMYIFNSFLGAVEYLFNTCNRKAYFD
jgi:hypothetical protein